MTKLKTHTFEEFIEVKGARAHNLKDIDVNIPRDQLVVITGLSEVENLHWLLILFMLKVRGAISRLFLPMHDNFGVFGTSRCR